MASRYVKLPVAVLKAALAAALMLSGGAASALDLLAVVRLAQDQDPTYQAGRHALEAAAEKLPQARAGLLPQVAATATRGRSEGDYSFSGGPDSPRRVTSSGWALQLTQPLIRPQAWAALSQAEFVVAQAHAQFAVLAQDLILRAAQAYFDLDVAREGLQVAQSQVTAVEQQLHLSQKGFASGTNAITDVHEAQARLDLARSQQVAAQNALDGAVAELEKIVGPLPLDGSEPDGPAGLADLPSIAPLNPDAGLAFPAPRQLQPWVDLARDSSPAVRVQKAAVGVAQAEVARAAAGHAPTLDLTASYGRNHASGSNTTLQDYGSRSRAGQMGLQFNLPLYTGGMNQSRVRESLALLAQASAGLETAQRLSAANARQAFAGIGNGLAQVEALQSAVESSRQAVKGNVMGVVLGTRISLDVLNAQQQLYAARRDLVKARYDVLLHGLRLKAAAGQLSEVDIALLGESFRRVPAPPPAQAPAGH